MTTEPDTIKPTSQDPAPIYDQYGTGSICGPEYYAGGEWSRRYTYRLANGHYLSITDYVAVIDVQEMNNRTDDDTEGYRYAAEGAVEYIEHTDPDDPGGTEVRSDYLHGEDSSNCAVFARKTIEEAEEDAKQIAARFSPDYFHITPETTI